MPVADTASSISLSLPRTKAATRHLSLWCIALFVCACPLNRCYDLLFFLVLFCLSFSSLLCCAVLYCAVLRCAAPFCAVLLLCCTTLFCPLPYCCAMLFCALYQACCWWSTAACVASSVCGNSASCSRVAIVRLEESPHGRQAWRTRGGA